MRCATAHCERPSTQRQGARAATETGLTGLSAECSRAAALRLKRSRLRRGCFVGPPAAPPPAAVSMPMGVSSNATLRPPTVASMIGRRPAACSGRYSFASRCSTAPTGCPRREAPTCTAPGRSRSLLRAARPLLLVRSESHATTAAGACSPTRAAALRACWPTGWRLARRGR